MAESENPVQNRRVTRRAFSEMPVLNDPQSLENFRGGASNLGNNMPNPMTPSSSPDELVIQRRGRREIPVIFSPDIDIIKQVINYIKILTSSNTLSNTYIYK